MTPQEAIKRYNIDNATINPDGIVDVAGDVNLGGMIRARLPCRFGKVSGDFYCGYNQLTSLEGAPSSVGGNFSCNRNRLTSLAGAPSSVGRDFYCNSNPALTSAKGLPARIGGEIIANDCGPGFEDSLAAERLLL